MNSRSDFSTEGCSNRKPFFKKHLSKPNIPMRSHVCGHVVCSHITHSNHNHVYSIHISMNGCKNLGESLSEMRSHCNKRGRFDDHLPLRIGKKKRMLDALVVPKEAPIPESIFVINLYVHDENRKLGKAGRKSHSVSYDVRLFPSSDSQSPSIIRRPDGTFQCK